MNREDLEIDYIRGLEILRDLEIDHARSLESHLGISFKRMIAETESVFEVNGIKSVPELNRDMAMHVALMADIADISFMDMLYAVVAHMLSKVTGISKYADGTIVIVTQYLQYIDDFLSCPDSRVSDLVDEYVALVK